VNSGSKFEHWQTATEAGRPSWKLLRSETVAPGHSEQNGSSAHKGAEGRPSAASRVVLLRERVNSEGSSPNRKLDEGHLFGGKCGSALEVGSWPNSVNLPRHHIGGTCPFSPTFTRAALKLPSG
jgi:hypothetical protein